MENLAKLKPNQSRDLASSDLGMISLPIQRGLDGLIGKGCIRSVAINAKTGTVFYALNPFGFALAEVAESMLPKIQPDNIIDIKEPADDQQ